jgi:capsular exopolysaccharide synthesis family protein
MDQKSIYLEEDNETVDFKGLFQKLKFNWKWIFLGIILCLIASYAYLRYTPDNYFVTAKIFINDEEQGGLASELSAFEDLGSINSSKTSVINETGILKSRSLMENVVKELKTNIAYYYKGNILNNELYYDKPFKINLLVKDSILYNLSEFFVVKPLSVNEFQLVHNDTTVKEDFGKVIEMGFGKMNIIPFDNLEDYIGVEIQIKISPLRNVVNEYLKKISIEPEEPKSSILILGFEDHVRTKGIDILNSLVKNYNLQAIEYKNLVTKNTDQFINDRVNKISEDLSDIDKGVEEFKIENKLSDIQYESSLNLSANSSLEKEILDINNQIQIVDYLTNHINSDSLDLIPTNMGLTQAAIVQNTQLYNKMLIDRNRILLGSSELNPTVINLDAEIAALRRSIIQSLSTTKVSLEFSLDKLKRKEYSLTSKKSLVPTQEREYQDIKRKQQIIESLYLYLLQKREENAITMGMPVPNAKIIDNANGSLKPESPKPELIYLIGFVLGFIIPVSIISLHTLFDTKVRTLDEIEKSIKAPVLGDIPKTKSKKTLVVSESKRDNIAEAFRLMRTNVSYMVSNNKSSKKIFVTSTIAGEGKTFISINLAASYAVLGKKVLLIGADLRKPKILQYLNSEQAKGLTNYLVDENISYDELLMKHEESNVDIIQAGEIPPNPSELLNNSRFLELLSISEEKYDYIIVDTPPIHLVTDTLQIIDKADLVVYTVRVDYLDKQLLKVPERLFKSKRIKNMAIIVNSTNFAKKGYGYGYGYGYGAS